jgi:hypothetical protein
MLKSSKHGARTSNVEVSNVTPHGLWLLLDEREFFLSFKDFPWFQDATIRSISKVELLSANHLYWPELDIDLAVDSIERPELFPLISK